MKRFRKLSKPYSRPVRKMGRLYSGGLVSLDEAYDLLYRIEEDVRDGNFELIKSMEWVEVRPPAKRAVGYGYKGSGVQYVPADLYEEYLERGFYETDVIETKNGYEILLITSGKSKLLIEKVHLLGKDYKLEMIKNYFIYKHEDIITLLAESKSGDWVVVYDVIDVKTGRLVNAQFASLLKDDINSGLVFVFGEPEKPFIAFEKHYMESFLRETAYREDEEEY